MKKCYPKQQLNAASTPLCNPTTQNTWGLKAVKSYRAKETYASPKQTYRQPMLSKDLKPNRQCFNKTASYNLNKNDLWKRLLVFANIQQYSMSALNDQHRKTNL